MTASLAGLSGAAILSVYAVGYFHTGSATSQLTTARLPGDSSPSGSTAPNSAAPAPATGPQVQRGPFDFGGADRNRDGDRGQAPGNTQPTPAAPQQPQPTPQGQGQPSATNPRTAPGGTTQQSAALHDGTFVGVGNSRHGGMQVSVVVKDGKIVSANVTGCGTRYPCSKINLLIGEVVSRQGSPVDYVSGATDSSMAYIQAVRSALSQASAQAS